MKNISQIEKETQGAEREEIHSEKVRCLLNEMPRSLTIWGCMVTAVVFIGIALTLCLMPYPYSGGESILEHLLNRH